MKERAQNKVRKVLAKIVLLSIVAFAVVCIAIICTNVSRMTAQASDSEIKNNIPESSNFIADGTTMPLTFWQKTISVYEAEMRETYTYKLEAITEDAPMPTGAEDRVYYFDITGDSSVTFNIDFNNSGFFEYRANMIIPEPQEYYTYDETYYDIKVLVYSLVGGEKKYLVFCLNPYGEKTVEPGWIISFDGPGPGPEPQPEPSPEIPPQTLDANAIICLAVIAILLLCAILAFIDKKKRRSR